MINTSRKHTEEEIINGCKKNDRYFQEVLYKSYFSECLYLCLRYTSDMDRAKMIVNDGFLKVFMNLDKFESRGSLKAWIKRIVFNAMSDHFRKESRYMKFILFEDAEKTELPDQNQDLFYEDLLKIVDELDETTRQVFVYFAIEGYAHKEIGEMLGISEGNSKWHLHKARKILQEKLINAAKLRHHAG